MSLYGMDVDSGRRLSDELNRSSHRLLDLSGSLTPLIMNVDWQGDDGQRFTNDWIGYRRQLIAAAHALAAASKSVKQNVEEQVNASNGSGGAQQSGGTSFLDQLLDSAAESAGDLWDAAGEVTSVFEESALATWHTVQDFVPPPLRNLMDAGENLASRPGDLAELSWRWLTSGEPPSITEIFSNGLLTTAAVTNFVVTTATLGAYNPHLLDDGRPVAGDPLAVGVGNPNGVDSNGRGNTPVPDTISAILGTTDAAYGDQGMPGTEDTGVRITTVQKPGEPPAYIVSIPGTTRWFPDGAENPTDLTGNLELAGGNLSTAAEAVQLAMERAGIPEGAPVMLSGHSQGGMIATALAADSGFTDQFNVTNVVTYGSPVDSTAIPPSIDVLAVQHAGDPVPRVDLEDLTVLPVGGLSASQDNNATIVTVPNPDVEPGIGNLNYHDGSAYVASVQDHEAQGPIAQYSQQESTQAFLTSDAGQVTSTVSNISRKQ